MSLRYSCFTLCLFGTLEPNNIGAKYQLHLNAMRDIPPNEAWIVYDTTFYSILHHNAENWYSRACHVICSVDESYRILIDKLIISLIIIN